MSDWYARKLAALQGHPTAPSQQPHYPPTQPLTPGQYAQPPQGGQQQPMERYTSYDANTGAQVSDDGYIAKIVQAAQTGGSRAVKEGSSDCPNCGGGNYFTIPGEGVFSRAVGGRVHAQQCADCNYPQVQSGSTGGALQGARSAGPATKARQLPDNHTVTVIGEGGQQQSFKPPTQR